MVKTRDAKAYDCTVCSKSYLKREAAVKCESRKNIPKYKEGEDVEGHITLSASDGKHYAFTRFKVISHTRIGHSFQYALEPNVIHGYSPPSSWLHTPGHYESPMLTKWKGFWVDDRGEDRKILKSLEGKLVDRITLPESKISEIMRFGAGERAPQGERTRELVSVGIENPPIIA